MEVRSIRAGMMSLGSIAGSAMLMAVVEIVPYELAVRVVYFVCENSLYDDLELRRKLMQLIERSRVVSQEACLDRLRSCWYC